MLFNSIIFNKLRKIVFFTNQKIPSKNCENFIQYLNPLRKINQGITFEYQFKLMLYFDQLQIFS